MTVPTLILIGELDDWTLGRGVPQSGGRPRRLGDIAPEGPRRSDQAVVYPGAYHAFDAPSLTTPMKFLGIISNSTKPATDQSIEALREFLDATIGGKSKAQ